MPSSKSMRTAVRRSPGTMLCSHPMDVIHALLAVGGALAENPAGWPLLVVFVYVIYACTHTAWDVFRAFMTFD